MSLDSFDLHIQVLRQHLEELLKPFGLPVQHGLSVERSSAALASLAALHIKLGRFYTALEALLLGRQYHQQQFDFALDGHWTVASNGLTLLVNHAGTALFNPMREFLAGKRLVYFAADQGRRAFYPLLEALRS